MNENLKVDKEYKAAYNIGFELAKELNLATPIFQHLGSDIGRINAMRQGMEQYSNDLTIRSQKVEHQHIESDKKSGKIHKSNSKKMDRKDNGRGLDLFD